MKFINQIPFLIFSIIIIKSKLSHFIPPYTLETVNTIDDSNHSPSEEYLVDFTDSKIYLRHLTPAQMHKKRVLYCHGKHHKPIEWDNGMNYHYRRWKFNDSKYKVGKKHANLDDMQVV